MVNCRMRIRRLTVMALTMMLMAACAGTDGLDRRARTVSPAVRTLSPTPALTPTPTPTPTQRAELPRGGRELFPRYRLVGYAGRHGSEALGRLGIGNIDDRAAELMKRARGYREDRQILPVFELIATVATSFPADDGLYRVRATDAIIGGYLASARRHKALLLLNVQPGRADFLPEVVAYEKWLREPDVSVALDPEWAVSSRRVPGEVYGRTTGEELDSVAAYLADLVERYDLPEKPLVFHQVHASIVEDQEALRQHPGIVVIKSVDGIGSPAAKEATWRRLTTGMPEHFHSGFKLFFVEDKEEGPLMTSEQVLALTPKPDYVMHE